MDKDSTKRPRTAFALGERLVVSEERWQHLRALLDAPGVLVRVLPEGLALPGDKLTVGEQKHLERGRKRAIKDIAQGKKMIRRFGSDA